MRALVIVDVQNDFCEGGSLAVDGAANVVRRINDLLDADHGYDYVLATKDFHVDPGDHFGDPPDYISSWPAHCVAGTAGAEFHPELITTHIDAVFFKGAHSAAYSGFEGSAQNSAAHNTALEDWLRDHHVDEIAVVGIATDYCVLSTATDAVRAGFRTRVLVGLTAGVAPDSTAEALAEMASCGVELVEI